MKIYTALFILLCVFPVVLYADIDATEIVRKSDELARGDTRYSELEMTIVRPDWTRTLAIKSWSIGSEYSMILITAPARERGQVFLKRGNEMWNWIPSIERIVNIPASMMMQSWMGSDLTNDDLLNEASIVNDYDHKILKEEDISGLSCWKIELLPHEDAAVVWGRILLWISKEGYHQMRLEYYDEFDELINYHIASDIKEMGNREIVTRYEIIPVDKKGHSTILKINHVEFDKEMEESFFSQQNMRRVR